MTCHALQINGDWHDLEGIQVGVGVKKSRPRDGWNSVDGHYHDQSSPRSSREWSLSFPPASAPDMVDLLTLVANGKGGDVRFFDASKARINMLDPEKTTGPAGNPLLAVGPRAVKLPSVTNGTAFTVTNLVRAYRPTLFSLWSNATAGATVATFNAGAGSTNLLAPSGTGMRPMSVSFTATTNYLFTVTIPGAIPATALRLTEGSVDVNTWLDGESMPCAVVVPDGDQTLQLLLDDNHGLSDYAFTVTEVAPW